MQNRRAADAAPVPRFVTLAPLARAQRTRRRGDGTFKEISERESIKFPRVVLTSGNHNEKLLSRHLLSVGHFAFKHYFKCRIKPIVATFKFKICLAAHLSSVGSDEDTSTASCE
ncbi:unnamed protein product, partial [Iphiclides podalirius]